MDFTVKPRRSLIVYMHSMKQVRQLKRFGLVQYQSHKEHYVVLYMDESQVPAATARINKLNFVRKVEPSYRPDVAMNFGERVDKGFFNPETTGAPDDED
ncbi:YlbG family protein [Lactiplantibacillus herbarum]|uniref:YlbG family protein n=1 Tax=Lactiplantibacillus herbarum TaxID=1670446 RepID=UPI00064F2816|nr:YlbG family protein [Lactiplantibacillus herbarum]